MNNGTATNECIKQVNTRHEWVILHFGASTAKNSTILLWKQRNTNNNEITKFTIQKINAQKQGFKKENVVIKYKN